MEGQGVIPASVCTCGLFGWCYSMGVFFLLQLAALKACAEMKSGLPISAHSVSWCITKRMNILLRKHPEMGSDYVACPGVGGVFFFYFGKFVFVAYLLFEHFWADFPLRPIFLINNFCITHFFWQQSQLNFGISMLPELQKYLFFQLGCIWTFRTKKLHLTSGVVVGTHRP